MKRLLVAAAVLTVAAGCSKAGAPSAAGATTPSPTPPPAVTASPTVASLNTTSLPLDRYTTSVDEYIELDYASKLMATECMKRFGIKWNPGERLKLKASRDRSGELGLINEATATRLGYHLDPDVYSKSDKSYNGEISDATALVLQGDRAGTSGRKDIPEGGCTNEGYRKVGWNLGDDEWLQELTNDARSRTFADKRAAKLATAWSACMRKSGYRYDTPTDAATDQRWWKDDDAPATAAEKSTAAADVRCKKKLDYLSTMTAILVAYQQQIVEGNLERLETVRRGTQDALKNAAKVLSGR